MNRLVAFTSAAFVAGAIVGALVVGSPFGAFAPKAVIMVHVENAGSGDISARIEVRDTAGKLVVGTTFTAPAHSNVEKSVVNLPHGTYTVRGTFTQGGATATDSARINTHDCPDGTAPLATFTLSGDGGVTMTGRPTAGCRA